MSEGCFNLRIFESNVASKSVDKHSGETFILGIIWDLDNDVLKCCKNFDSLTCEVKITKRLVLSTVQKVFDPIGMLAPSTLLPKLLLQEIWKMKKAWDQELPQNIVNKFMKWFNEVQILKDVTVPRCMKIDIFTELHVFVDASKGSYAGCVFARSIVDLANDAPPLLICNVSDYDKMIRVFAWILRFVNNCRKDYNKLKSLSSGPSPLPPDRVNDCAIFEVVGIET
ncbi:uncharacterized protein TNCV_4176531 [Trichonephila clavipes]|nr:uncharacterized protein TNCV_4176531 [Trichonephila clavipes]